MKVTRRSDKGKGGHLLISVPANRVGEVEAALNFLEAQREKRGSQVVIDLIVRAAKRGGWKPDPQADSSPAEQLSASTEEAEQPDVAACEPGSAMSCVPLR